MGALPPGLLAWIFVLALPVYGLLGGLGAVLLWRPSRSPNPREDPAAHAAYWFPSTTALLLYVWLSAVIYTVCLLVFTPLLQGPDAGAFLLGAGLAPGSFALLFGVILLGYRRLQQFRRRSNVTPATGASEA